MISIKTKNNHGFSLIEVLLAVSIFGILSVVLSAIFLNVSNLQKATANFQRLQNEGRYIIEKLSREIRGREIDYPVNSTNDKISFRKDEMKKIVDICLDDYGNLNYYYGFDDGNCKDDGQQLNAEDVEVSDIKFFILPTAEDLWSEDPTDNTQPRVTILLTIKNRNPDNPNLATKFQKSLTFQTTISSKYYKR